MSRVTWLAVAAGVLGGFSSAQAQGRLEGIVRRADTGAVLAGVQVLLPAANLGATTGPSGRYAVGDIPAGAHEV